MLQENGCLQKAVKQVIAKGNPIILVGATGSGKSTAIESLASNADVQSILAMRAAQGKGSISQTNIIVTDFSDIPEDSLIVTAHLRSRDIVDLADDNAFLGKVICAALKRTPSENEKDYRANLATQLTQELEHSENDTLAYRLQNLTVEDKAELLGVISDFPFDRIYLLYSESLVKNNNSYKNVNLIFSFLLTKSEECQENVKAFWETVKRLVNKKYQALKQKLVEHGLVQEDSAKGVCEFTAVFNKDTMQDVAVKNLADILLKPAYSEEYLLADTALVFRGKDDLFKINGVDNFSTVLEKENGGEKIHCIRLVDTMGLFHATETTSDNEILRITDILTKYHSGKVIFVMNAERSDTTEKTDNALHRFLTEANREIKIYFLHTHYDTYLYKYFVSHSATINLGGAEIDWAEIYKNAHTELNDRIKWFRDALDKNRSKKKPALRGSSFAAVTFGMPGIHTILRENDIGYPRAWYSLLNQIASDAEVETRYKIKAKGETNRTTLEQRKNSLDSLYQNLVECKDKKLYSATVRACVNKWCHYGAVHESHVQQNDYGYENITTTFVQEIRNYFLLLLKGINTLNYADLLADKTQSEKFEKDLTNYFKSNQNLGRKAAELIAKDAFEHEYRYKVNTKYLNECFHDMLQFTQENYFPSKEVVCTRKSEECLYKAMDACIDDFINERCTVVY